MIQVNVYKQYAALATKWNKDVLFRARVNLTLAYVGIATVILALFSYLLYRALLVGFADSIREQVPGLFEQRLVLAKASELIQSQILMIDAVTLFCVLIGGFILTSITLKPVRVARERERRLLADAVHELRTPLAIMKSGTEVLLRGEAQVSPKVHKALVENIEEIDALTLLANNLLSLTRDKTQGTQDETLIVVAELLTQAVEKLSVVGADKKVSLSITIDADAVKATVKAQLVTLSRAIENLIENGIKYTNEGGSVTVKLSVHKHIAVITVADTGIGISPEDLPHVTEPFFRADSARTANEGTGLGLAIVAETIELLQGTLSIKSEVNVGTTVTVSVPLASD